MNTNKKTLSMMISTILCATLIPLTGCDKKTPDQATASNAASAPAQTAYVPPTADQLYQMVGPIALFPDKLVAQVLAGSSYPNQITAADNWAQQNKSLTPAQMQAAVNQQPWDVSIKGLVMFPDVLDQMAKNIQWTTALGTAYVNDPTDVMNAIQVMRQRASTSGNLKASKQQKITITPRIHRAPDQGYDVQEGEPVVYSGPNVISPPDQTIVIEPYDSDVVYVPSYNPRVAYGEPMQVYPGYQEYEQPPRYSTSQIVTAGALTFGAGIAIAALSHHDGGWNSWGVHWGGHRNDQNNSRDNGGPQGGWHRPAVEYNNSTYVSRSTTITNNNTYYNNSINTRNTTNNNARPMDNHGMPNGNPNRPNRNPERPNFAPQQQTQAPQAPFGERPNPAQTGQPNFNNMQRPHFNQHEAMNANNAMPSNDNRREPFQGQRQATGNPPQPATPLTPPNVNPMQQPHFNHHEGATAGAMQSNTGYFGRPRPEQPNVQTPKPITPTPAPQVNNAPKPNFEHHQSHDGVTAQPAQQSMQRPSLQPEVHEQPQQHMEHQWNQPPHTQPVPQPIQRHEPQPQAMPHQQPHIDTPPPAQHQEPHPQEQRAQPQPPVAQPAPQPQVQKVQRPTQGHFGERPHPEKKDEPKQE